MKKSISFLFGLVILLLIRQCAKEAAPMGGPKDFDPPVVVAEVPANQTTNFESKRAKIYFDEFVKLTDLQKELLISPPFQKRPKFIVKGKRLIITFLDTLPTDKTVNINFYNSIVDVNESNVLKNYQYVFSTGPEIDTSFIDGRVLDAKTGLPMENELVYAYEKFYDSVVSKELPDYIARTNKDGIFVLNNLGEGPYKLFSLVDKNRNNLYDQPTERTAFITDSIIPAIEWTTMMDTIRLIDSIDVTNNDTIYRDSFTVNRVQVSKLKPFQLRVFTKDYKRHYLTNSTRERKAVLSLGFNRDIDTIGYDIELIKPQTNNNSWYKEEQIEKDSVLLWITDSVVYNSDSLYCKIDYPYTDSAGKIITKTDSIYFIYDFEKIHQKDTSLVLKNSLRTNKLDIDTAFEIFFSEPIKTFNSSKIYLKIQTDTAFVDHNFETKLSDDKQSMQILYNQDILAQYRFIADSAAFTGIYNNINDSLTKNYMYYQYEDYGNLIINIDTIPQNNIFRLYNKSGEIVRTINLKVGRILNFKQLPPGEYSVRLLIDSNNNGKWNTGNYYDNKQPELVISYPGSIPIKANWDTEQNWILSKELKLYD